MILQQQRPHNDFLSGVAFVVASSIKVSFKNFIKF